MHRVAEQRHLLGQLASQVGDRRVAHHERVDVEHEVAEEEERLASSRVQHPVLKFGKERGQQDDHVQEERLRHHA